MRGILIDARKKEISEISISGLKDMQKAVNGNIENGGRINENNIFYVDEEGLLKDNKYGFMINKITYAGNGLILGVNDETGEEIDTSITISQAKDIIRFLEIFVEL